MNVFRAGTKRENSRTEEIKERDVEKKEGVHKSGYSTFQKEPGQSAGKSAAESEKEE